MRRNLFSLLLVAILATAFAGTVGAFAWEEPQQVPLDKQWTVEFNTQVDRTTINEMNIFVTDKDDFKFNVVLDVSVDGKRVRISPLQPYQPRSVYQLHITEGVQSSTGLPLRAGLVLPFKTMGSILSPSEIAKIAGPAVVYIEAFNREGDSLGTGSGFITQSQGEVVTNFHVIEGAFAAKVVLSDGRTFDVEYVLAFDIYRDVAVLQIAGTDLPVVELGDSDNVTTGDKVVAIGSPQRFDNTVSDGLISHTSRILHDYDGQTYLQTTAPISPGSSGGALLNEYGEVIGITTLIYLDGQNLNFAIPINDVKPFLGQEGTHSLAEVNGSSLPPLSAPRDLQVTAGDRELLLQWSHNWEPWVEGYYLYTSDSRYGTYEQVRLASGSHLFTLPAAHIYDLNNGVPYYYYVKAVSYDGTESLPSTLVEGIPKIPIGEAPAAIQDLEIATEDGKIYLSWTPNQDTLTAGYYVYEANSSQGPYRRLLFDSGSYMVGSSDITVYNTTSGQTFYYYVTAVSANNVESEPSQVVHAIPRREIWEVEPNDTFALADWIEVGNFVRGELNGDDIDVFFFEVPTKGTLWVGATALSLDADLRIILFNIHEEAMEVAHKDGETERILIYEHLPAGYYYLALFDWNDDMPNYEWVMLVEFD